MVVDFTILPDTSGAGPGGVAVPIDLAAVWAGLAADVRAVRFAALPPPLTAHSHGIATRCIFTCGGLCRIAGSTVSEAVSGVVTTTVPPAAPKAAAVRRGTGAAAALLVAVQLVIASSWVMDW